MLSESLKGRVAVVTGGSRGIGRAIALRLAESGADVALIYAGNQAAADETAQQVRELGVRAMAVQCDVSDAQQAAAAIKQVRAELGPIDILVNNAGITRDGISLRMKPDDFRRVIDVNLTGAFLMAQAAMSDFVRRRSGRIINISSASGLMGNAGQANYSAAKAGMIGLTKTLARELAGRGVTVNAVAPGFVRTEMTAAMNEAALSEGLKSVPMGRMAEPEEIAEAVAFLASDRAAYITGTVLSVNGGLYM
ncbi:MAG TPA: 3-oxoacyl-[acyl-carrier-protein] reductase [Candidatus Fimadaptatus faecigallinarum]|uniref:3-oxoacyl-[acyl-carrier-protein] reductase n=1 Tax=Candidatus Fimadaptatus faecigallinarum TaxID=2840814 RepID=A0A9D1LS81_9FIRM|nr:3-oxoacyl-[acyl-carrier-protein] reductase [Candidatus Fimadaptatus faecigallinarum]